MPQVHVNLYAGLRQFVGGDMSREVTIEPGQTIQQVLAQIGVTGEKTRIIFVNGRHGTLSDALEGGETLGVFPAIGGG